MTAGEGGMVTTEDPELFERAWSYANLGRIREREWYYHAVHGTNLRMTEWQGAVLRAQLERLPGQHRTREERGDLLDAELAKLPGVRTQPGDPRMDSRARWAYGIHYDEDAFSGLSREGFEAALTQEGIPLGFRYPEPQRTRAVPPGQLRAGRDGAPQRYPRGSLPRAEDGGGEHDLARPPGPARRARGHARRRHRDRADPGQRRRRPPADRQGGAGSPAGWRARRSAPQRRSSARCCRLALD